MIPVNLICEIEGKGFEGRRVVFGIREGKDGELSGLTTDTAGKIKEVPSDKITVLPSTKEQQRLMDERRKKAGK